jgi:hypothetical protein
LRVRRHQGHRIEQRHDRIDLGIACILLRRPDRGRRRLDLEVADTPGHQRRYGVTERAVGQLPLHRLDRVHHGVALRRADQKLALDGDADRGQRIGELAEARRDRPPLPRAGRAP